MLKTLLLAGLFMSVSFFANAAFVPENNETTAKEKTTKTISLAEYEAATGKKLNWIERMQFKHAQKLIASGKVSIFGERDELTEGFQPLPFFGSLLTGGIVYIVMLFTAKDANALRWAQWGALIVWTAFAVTQLVLLLQGGY